MKKLLLISLLMCSAHADDIIIVNNTLPESIWVAVYKLKGDATRTAGPQMIPGNSKIEIMRPSMSLGVDRELAFDYTQDTLQPKISGSAFNQIRHTNIGYTHGAWNVKPNFYIAKENGVLKGYGAFMYKAVKPVREILGSYELPQSVASVLQSTLPAIQNNPYKNHIAAVRQGNGLCDDEKRYLAVRMPKVRSALERFLGRSLDGKYVPKVAIVGSGGGYRAMLCTTGSLVGAQKIGLLDATTYISALSGSTWALAGWLSHNETIEQFKFSLIPKLTSRGGKSPLPGIMKGLDSRETQLIAEALLAKMAFSQPITLVDIYGGLLATSLLSDFDTRRQMVHLSDQAARIANGDFPFPLYTAVAGEGGAKSDWYEFSPYEIGAAWMGSGMYVPAWAYGRKFADGRSVDYAPEQSLGFLMGTWGSAFAAEIAQMYMQAEQGIQNDIVKMGANFLMSNLFTDLSKKRIEKAWAEVFNWSFGLANSSVRERSFLKLVDGGATPGFNLPYPPISGERPERQADVIILLDASAGNLAGELRQVENYARSKGLKFPPINYDGIDKRAITVFKHETDPSVPVVVYMPRIKDQNLLNQFRTQMPQFAQLLDPFDVEKCVSKEFCATLNFEYEPHESSQLTALTEFNILANTQAIKDAINWVVDRR